MKISLVVTTYNWPQALEQVLGALNEQDTGDFEVIVADDGSAADTREMIDTLRPQLRYPLFHVWQEDLGFRAARVRNLGIRQASGKYIVFLDGDCVPTRAFIAQHRALAEPGWFVAGNRVTLERQLSEQVLAQKQPLWRFSLAQWWALWLRKRINKFRAFLHLPLGPLRKLRARRWQGVMSCNLAAWKADLVAVNGYDESFEGWGFEDSDLVIRLLNHGIQRKSGQFAVTAMHFWHASAHREDHAENLRRLDEIVHSRRVRAMRGLEP